MSNTRTFVFYPIICKIKDTVRLNLSKTFRSNINAFLLGECESHYNFSLLLFTQKLSGDNSIVFLRHE